jgi:hypothetical protein
MHGSRFRVDVRLFYPGVYPFTVAAALLTRGYCSAIDESPSGACLDRPDWVVTTQTPTIEVAVVLVALSSVMSEDEMEVAVDVRRRGDVAVKEPTRY